MFYLSWMLHNFQSDNSLENDKQIQIFILREFDSAWVLSKNIFVMICVFFNIFRYY